MGIIIMCKDGGWCCIIASHLQINTQYLYIYIYIRYMLNGNYSFLHNIISTKKQQKELIDILYS